MGSIYSVANVGAYATAQALGSLLVNYSDLAASDDGIQGQITLTGPSCSWL
jgi:hypothetical protein